MKRVVPAIAALAFVAALGPATIVLLGVEMKLLSGRMQAYLWTFPAAGGDARR